MHDTSHYAECAAIMQQHKSSHMKRFFLILLLTVFNGYFHIMTMPIWRAEEGVFPIAIFGLGFFWGVFALLYNIAVVVLGLLATPEKPVLCWVSFGLVLLGLFLNLMNPILGIAIAILFIIGIIDSKKAAWIKAQPGYPYFNERFTQQESIAFQDYNADHNIRDRADDDMEDISEAKDTIPTPAIAEMPDVEFLIPDIAETPTDSMKPKTEVSTPKSTPLPSVDAAAIIAPMYGEEPKPAEIQKPKKKKWNFKEKLQSEPEVPKVDFSIPTDIPDPVWDVPDPVMNTEVILSDIPEISGDIQDLPDIPDIPQI
ncbi:MAG: hypothetical protein E7504_08220 [Ruminococcus sp.]|nr:hypothetical protein [Ruminococcus sp.]